MRLIIRFLFVGLLLGFISNTTIAQKKKTSKSKTTAQKKAEVNSEEYTDTKDLADRYFANEEYYNSAMAYLKAVTLKPTDKYSAFKLAESYRLYFNYDEAEKWYDKADQMGATADFPLTKYWLGNVQKLNGKYEPAKASFDGFLQAFQPQTQDERNFANVALTEYNGCVLAIEQLQKPLREYGFRTISAPVNSKNFDYAPTIFENDSSIVVTSAREDSKGDETYSMLGEEFSDNYRFEKRGKVWAQVTAKEKKDNFEVVNTNYNDGAGCFNKENNKYYYTRCAENTGENNGECAIYFTKKVGDKWIKPVKLNEYINMPKYWNAQPSLTLSGDTMFFVSKRPGGIGNQDIWYSTKQPGTDENWGPAVNMGDKINTPFTDMSPNYYSAQKVLFFASTGHEGFGGLDILMAKGANLDTILNIGLPFNSNRDDFYFALGDSVGYLVSNRDGGMGKDDIYRFNIKSRESVIAVILRDSLISAKSISIVGRILFDDSQSPATDIAVYLTDDNGVTLKIARTNNEGYFRFDNLPADKNYRVVLQEDDPRLTAQIDYIVDDLKIKGSDQMSTRTLFENVYFDYDLAELRPEGNKILDDIIEYYKENKEGQFELKANTDNFGKDLYNKSLSEKRGKACYDYLVSHGVDRTALVISAQGEAKPIADNKSHAGRQLNRRVEFYLVGNTSSHNAKGMIYIVEPKKTLFSIARDFGMSVDELKEMNGITGSEVKAFSPLRVKRSGDAEIIAPASFQLVTKVDENTSKKVNNKKEKVKIEIPINPIPETDNTTIETKPTDESLNNVDIPDYHTVQVLETLFMISKKYNVSVEKIKELNGLNSNKLIINQKLKLK